ncbi:MAG: glycosyltransferase family 4 protein [Chlorobium sp.]
MKGGIARFSGLLLAALRKGGDDVVPLAFRALFPAFIAKGTSAPLPEEFRLVLFNPFSWPEAIRRISLLKPDIVLVAYWTGFLAPLCFVVRRFTGIRMVVLLHNLSSHESFFFEPFLQRLLAASADGVLTLSGAVSEQVHAAFPSLPLCTLFHPVYDPEGSQPLVVDARHELHLDSSSPVLLFFGYVRSYKGLETMLRAMPAILLREPSLRLVVAGHFYEDVSLYRQLVDQLGISGSVDLYPGYVSAERSALYFAAADAVVLPYRNATQSGVVQLAYGYGLPVIVTPVGALPEMVCPGKTGWVARDSSPEGFAKAVGEFLDARERLPLMRPAIEAFRREYSWEAFAASAGSFLDTIAAGR